MEFALARGAAVWRGLERGIDTFSLENVISLRSRAADLRRSLDTVIMHADRRTDQLRQGKTQMKKPDDADWVWRPDVFASRQVAQWNMICRPKLPCCGKSWKF